MKIYLLMFICKWKYVYLCLFVNGNMFTCSNMVLWFIDTYDLCVTIAICMFVCAGLYVIIVHACN